MIHGRVSVFCASSAKVNGEYLKAASRLGKVLAYEGIAVNYGGGAVGLMGAMANSVMDCEGSIRGIIPQFMVDQGWNHPGVEDMVIVKDMHERMKKLIIDVDAFITLPGGVGTLEELLEMISHKQLGQILQPIIIVNTNNFFAPFLQMLDKMVDEKFMRPVHKDIWTVVEHPEEVITAINSAPDWDGSAIKYAPV